MNHRKGNAKLNLRTGYRKALLNNLMSALVDKEQIVTTKARAKETQRLVEKLITKAKNAEYEKYIKNYDAHSKLKQEMKNMHQENKSIALTQDQQNILEIANKVTNTYRLIARHVKQQDLQKKLISDIGVRVKNRKGGYTRIFHLGKRKGDASEMALLELVDKPKTEKKTSEAKQKKEKVAE